MRIPVALVVGLCAIYAAAQTPAQESAAGATVEGFVLAVETGEPIADAEVFLDQLQDSRFGQLVTIGSRRYVTRTDELGHFIFTDVTPNKYTVSAQVQGHINKPATSWPTSLSDGLTSGERVNDIVLRMEPQGVVTGRVVDANGEPVADTAVYMSQPSYYDGPRKLAGGKSARTNDRGEYRVFWLEPGEYYPQTASRITTRTTGTIYYPGSADIGDARPITVQRGAVLTGIDFILPPPRDIPDFTISGRAVDSAGAGAAIGDFSLVRREGNGFREQYFQNLAADRSSGRFRLRGVEPGSYRLFPSNTDIQVVDSDIENITIRISPGVTVSGRMVIDGNRVDPDYLSGGVQVSLASIEGMPGILYQKIRGITPDNGRLDAATGEFRFIDVPPGRYNLRFAFALPNGAYFADVRQAGKSVFDDGFEVGIGTPEPIEFVASRISGVIEGEARDVEQRPIANAVIVLVPPPARRHNRELYRDVRSDKNGRFTFKGASAPPGNYSIFAWETVPTGAWLSSDFMAAYEHRGTSVLVEPGITTAVSVTVNPKVAP